MKKTFLSILFIGSCAFINAQEVATPEPAFDATVGYTESITLRGLSYGGDGVITGIHGKIPTKWADLMLARIICGATTQILSLIFLCSHLRDGVGINGQSRPTPE